MIDHKSNSRSPSINSRAVRISKMGYEFDYHSDEWELDGSTKLNLKRMRAVDEGTKKGLRMALCRYAEELAAKTTNTTFSYFNMYCDATGEASVSVLGLSNWKATLSNDQESRLGSLKSFLISWYEWGFTGIGKDVVDYLDSIKLKGIVKGKAVKGMCPYSGPLTPQEQGALLDWAAGAL